MGKENWGIKRVCMECDTRFYDFNKSPIICPSCGAAFDPEYLLKKKSKVMRDKSDDIVVIDIIDDELEDEADDVIPIDDATGDVALDSPKEK
jgi:uncharacterized protein (TIGR02300 family)